MPPIQIPDDWDDKALISFEEFCILFNKPPGTVRHWRRHDVGPVWVKIPGTGHLYTTVRECRRLVASAIAWKGRSRG